VPGNAVRSGGRAGSFTSPAVPAVCDRARRRRLRGLRAALRTIKYKPYRERAETQAQGDLIVTVALPTAAEAADIYGVDLAKKQIQAVWIEVRNNEAVPYWFLISGLDPNYVAASEAAHAFHATTADGAGRALDERFDGLEFRNPAMPGATVSGS
jgi:hypothetical protein